MSTMRKACLLVLPALVALACASPKGTGLLPKPPDNPREAGFRPAVPFEPGPVEGAATRVVYRAESGRGYTVEVTDVAVGPGRAVSVPFAGPAMVEVRHGNGAGSTGGRNVELQMGATLAVAEGETLTITAREPMTLRAYVYRTR